MRGPTGKMGPGPCPVGAPGTPGPPGELVDLKGLQRAKFKLALAKDAARLNRNRLACFGGYDWNCQQDEPCPYCDVCQSITQQGVELEGDVVILTEL